MFGFRSHAFGVVSDHAFVSFLFQRTHKKKAEKEKPIDEDLADSTGLMEKLRKRRAGLRKVYGKTTCTILFVDLPSSNMRSPCSQLTHVTKNFARTGCVGQKIWREPRFSGLFVLRSKSWRPCEGCLVGCSCAGLPIFQLRLARTLL